ncbi:hypothetical protein [Clostridium sp. FP1]|uniref:hypothetical protein n=1 Tax=Clostridium sp. FP1 TaxID=2724076 RepID=UPI0013E9846D|nr:hypothetical protein [Clostridium sp. FP1]MBZ9636332.1 hypothetical protein [Clostridium sp. FP1]
MLNRFWNYQLLLSGSLGFVNAKKTSKLHFFILFISILFMGIFTGMLDGGGVIFYPIVFTLYADYHIINSQNRLFEIVPVSKLYVLINIYLYVFVMSLFFTGGAIIGLVPFKILTLFTSTFTLVDTIISLLVNNWRAILVAGCISTIIVSILLPIFFIKPNLLRKALTISAVALVTIALLLFRNTLPVITELGEINFLESITIMPHYNEILLILCCVCIVIIPISIFISYKLYKGKRCLVC